MDQENISIVSSISDILKAARKAKRLSQRELASLTGMPQSHISRIENAGVDLRISSLTEITRALDLELTLVPRKAGPAVRSIIRSVQAAQARPQISEIGDNPERGQTSRSAYSLEDPDD